MAINREDFARDCVDHAFRFGVNPHYLVAVAELLSDIKDDSDGDRIGPFRITQADWNAKGSEPKFELTLQPAQINRPGLQCVYAALQTLRAQEKFLKENNDEFPNPDQLYKIWPAVPEPAGKTLLGVLNSTRDLIEPAAEAALEDFDFGALVGDIKLDSIKDAAKKQIAVQIITSFAAAGYGKLQQVAGLANAIVESGLNPRAHNTDGEDSVGLFQLNRDGGVGAGHSVESLMDPAKNIELIIAEAKQRAPEFKTATTLQNAISIFVKQVERPREPAGEIIVRLAKARELLPA